MRNDHLEREWIMLAAAALAGGKSTEEAVSAADSIADAFVSRYKPEDKDD